MWAIAQTSVSGMHTQDDRKKRKARRGPPLRQVLVVRLLLHSLIKTFWNLRSSWFLIFEKWFLFFCKFDFLKFRNHCYKLNAYFVKLRNQLSLNWFENWFLFFFWKLISNFWKLISIFLKTGFYFWKLDFVKLRNQLGLNLGFN